MKQFKRFINLADRNERLIAGLMSGTSADGIDGCIVRFSRENSAWKWSVEGTVFIPYEEDFRKELLRAASDKGTVFDLCRLSFALGEKFAFAVNSLLEKSRISKDEISLVVSHGHTVCHCPPVNERMGSTLQVGEGAVIAERTQIPVLEDLRVSDVAAGGHGAPLVPAADRMLFMSKEQVIAIQNIGGIGNITFLDGYDQNVTAYDTGPGNMLIDIAVTDLSNGTLSYDKDGTLGAKGTVSTQLLQYMMNHEYIQKNPPKTTGREEFGQVFYEKIKEKALASGLSPGDILTTVTAFTASSIQKAVEDYSRTARSIDSFYVAGGGAFNGFLMELISGLWLQ